VHSEATRMVKASAALRKRLRTFVDNIHSDEAASKFEPLTADATTLDGLNPHGAIIDEFHAHKDGALFDVLDTATGARRQPLIYLITTAGYDRKSACYQMHEYTRKVLSRVVNDDSHFGIIYALDDEDKDNWEDERLWAKANPNLGVSKYVEQMRDKALKAKEMPSRLNAFLRLELNVWTQSATKWINADKWRACASPVDALGLRGRRCFGGLDLASRVDIAAWLLCFPPQRADDPYAFLCRFWVPDDAVMDRVKRDRVPYDAWIRQGHLMTTPGAVIDHDHIQQQIEDDCATYEVDSLAYDRWNALELIAKIEKEQLTKPVQFGQGFSSMSAPTKEFEALIAQRRIAHGGNPVLTWMADNVVVARDAADNMKPNKEQSTEKIDGIVAAIMALDLAIRNAGNDDADAFSDGILTL
jgi:phage terminase large subunit-like protein